MTPERQPIEFPIDDLDKPVQDTHETMLDAQEPETLSPYEYGKILVHLAKAKREAIPKPGESERVVMGTLMPDRRLSNSDRDLQRKIFKSARKRYRVGELPNRELIAEKLRQR